MSKEPLIYTPQRDKFGIQWVMTWEQFRECGGTIEFSEQQHRLVLRLAEPYRFSPHFMAECT